jgi:hypothetical protein
MGEVKHELLGSVLYEAHALVVCIALVDFWCYLMFVLKVFPS